jgi:uncharacterized protein (TIGR02246 family)
MTAQAPEEVYHLFAEALNAGDIEALMALFEPDAVFVTEPGHPVTGTEHIRGALEGILALKGIFRLATTGILRGHDLAFVAPRWSIEGTGPDGQPVTVTGVTADVVRRGTDGVWRFALDNPWGADTVQAAPPAPRRRTRLAPSACSADPGDPPPKNTVIPRAQYSNSPVVRRSRPP